MIKKDDTERRRFEVRAGNATDGAMKLAGHAAVFNQETDMGWFREMIMPGAFLKSIGQDDIRALFNHDENIVLGRNRSGTLTLSEDAQGLAVEIIPPDTEICRGICASIERRDISEMSFAFRAITEEWQYADTPDASDLRILKECKLYDVSPVTYAAYDGTDIGVRAEYEGLEIAKRSHSAWTKEHPRTQPTPTEQVRAVDIDIKKRKLKLKISEGGNKL